MTSPATTASAAATLPAMRRFPVPRITESAAAAVIAKHIGVLAAADIEIFTRTTTFAILQSLRLDYGPSEPVHL